MDKVSNKVTQRQGRVKSLPQERLLHMVLAWARLVFVPLVATVALEVVHPLCSVLEHRVGLFEHRRLARHLERLLLGTIVRARSWHLLHHAYVFLVGEPRGRAIKHRVLRCHSFKRKESIVLPRPLDEGLPERNLGLSWNHHGAGLNLRERLGDTCDPLAIN